MNGAKGFWIKAVVRSDRYAIGDRFYVKAKKLHYNTPVLYSALNPETGVEQFDIDANELRNRFERDSS